MRSASSGRPTLGRHRAGFDPAALDAVGPLLKRSDRGEKIRKQMGGSAPAPDWKK